MADLAAGRQGGALSDKLVMKSNVALLARFGLGAEEQASPAGNGNGAENRENQAGADEAAATKAKYAKTRRIRRVF